MGDYYVYVYIDPRNNEEFYYGKGTGSRKDAHVEKTLLWKLGKWTTNIATGHFADKFRPHNTLHKELSGFDYQNGIYYYNVGGRGASELG